MASGVDPFKHAQTASDVKRIYREEASRLHPNRHPKASNSQKKVHTHRFQEMALSYEEAMQRISDPSYRASEELHRREEEHEHERRERNRMRQAKEREAARRRQEERARRLERENPDLRAMLNAARRTSLPT
jgi:DnaJ-class molecular chaperone